MANVYGLELSEDEILEAEELGLSEYIDYEDED